MLSDPLMTLTEPAAATNGTDPSIAHSTSLRARLTAAAGEDDGRFFSYSSYSVNLEKFRNSVKISATVPSTPLRTDSDRRYINELRRPDQYPHDENEGAADEAQNKRRRERRVHVTVPNPGNYGQFHCNHNKSHIKCIIKVGD